MAQPTPKTPCPGRGRPRGGAPLLLLAAGTLALAACAPDARAPGSAGGWAAAYDTVGDTIVVRTISGSIRVEPWRLVEEMSFGGIDGPEEYVFGRISSLAVGPRGRIFVLDEQAPALRVYDALGRYLATWGSKGNGPGEYARPRALAVLSDGRVLVRDPDNGRITVFSPEGEPLDTWPIRGTFHTSRPLYTDRQDRTYTMIVLDPEADLDHWTFGLIRFAPDGTPEDTIPAPPARYHEAMVEARNKESWSRTGVPFSPAEGWEFSPLGYFVHFVTSRYALELLRPDQPVLRIEKEYAPVPVAPGEARAARERIERDFRQIVPSWKWRGPPVPDHKPPFRRVILDAEGRIWVRLSRPGVERENPAYDPRDPASPATEWLEPVSFDLFMPDGAYLGRVDAPEGFSPSPWPVARGDTVWAVVQDELGVPRVTRFRQAPAPTSSASAAGTSATAPS